MHFFLAWDCDRPLGAGWPVSPAYGLVGFLSLVIDLAAWQVDFDRSLDQWWLSRDQLGQRLEVTELEWAGLDADPRVVRFWEHRYQLHERLK